MLSGSGWAYGAASAVADVDDGLGMVRVRGIITPATSLALLQHNTRWISEKQVVCQVADYSQAGIALDAERLLSNVHAALQKGHGLRTPTALVVPADTLPLFNSYAWMMAQAGITRAVFTDPRRAAEWAATQALALSEIRGELARRGLPARSAGTDRPRPSVRA